MRLIGYGALREACLGSKEDPPAPTCPSGLWPELMVMKSSEVRGLGY